MKFKALKISIKMWIVAVTSVLLIVGVNAFNNLKIDLTEQKLHTLLQGSKNIVSKLDTPIVIDYFFSDTASKDIQVLRTYAKRVRDLLSEYERVGGSNIVIHEYDPIAFSEEEDLAAEYGLQAAPIGNAQDNIYFGLVIRRGDHGVDKDKAEVIPFLHPSEESKLEYEISRSISKLSNDVSKKIGVITGLSVNGGYDMHTRQMGQPWVFLSQMQALHEVEMLDIDLERVDDDIETLLVVHPKKLSDHAVYAIDQFVLRGGKLVLFVDPFAESEAGGHTHGAEKNAQSSDIKQLFSHWGVAYDSTQIIGDATTAMTVGSNQHGSISHLSLNTLTNSNFASDFPLFDGLESINIGSSGSLSFSSDSKFSVTPLLESSVKSALMPSSKLSMMRDVRELWNGFVPDDKTYTIAAHLTGNITSAFDVALIKEEENQAKPEGSLVDSAETIDQDAINKEKMDKATKLHLAESKSPANIMIFADTDLLTDRLWVRVQKFFGQVIAQPWADNGTFVTNLVDMMMGSEDLMTLRSRGVHKRSFTKVESLQKIAQESYLSQEKALQDKLNETEQKLAKLQKSPSDGAKVFELNDEQRAAIDAFMKEKLAIRKELRMVRFKLDESIKSLGFTLKAINTLLIPLLIILIALVYRFKCCNKS